MKENFYRHKLLKNNSSPLLLGNDSDNVNNKYLTNNSNNKSIKFSFNRKLLPLNSPNKIMLKKISFAKRLFNPDSFKTRNKKMMSKSCDIELNGETTNVNTNNIMKKYFNPDNEENHELSNKLNEKININQLLTFYSKLKFKKERAEVQKMINTHKNMKIISNENSMISPLSIKSRQIKRSSIQSDTNISNISEKINSSKTPITGNNFITLDIYDKIYKNPLHSFDTIKKNKLIFNSVIEDYNFNRFKKFKKLENELGPRINLQHNTTTKNANNVKVLPYIPRSPSSNFEIKVDESTNAQTRKSIKEGINILNKAMPLYFSKFLLGKKRGEKLLLKVSNLYAAKNSPESRSQFIFVKEENDIVLYGGYNISRKNNLWIFNPFQKTWTSLETIGLSNQLRYAHSGVLYNRNLYIFGGKYFRTSTFANIEIFNLEKQCWTIPKLESEKRIPLRRNHVACRVGDAMFVHGGMTEDNTYLDDMYLLNFKPLKWIDIEVNKSEVKIPPLAFHSCCFVMPEFVLLNTNFNIYSMPELGERGKKIQIKEKGIYIFGGKTSDDGIINDNLYVIKVGTKPVEIVVIKANGVPPSPRYDSSLNFYEKGNMLIVHGGRTNKGEFKNGLNDTFIFDLHSLTWTQVEYFNDKYIVPPRYFHQSVVFAGELYIFGGMNGNNYIGSELEVIDLNSNFSCIKEKYIIESQRKKIEEAKRNSMIKEKRNSSISKRSVTKFSLMSLIKK